MIKCITNKKAYPTLEIAEDVLIETWTRFNYALNSGPIAVYKCDDCGQYHLTSKGIMNAKLATNLANGKIKLQKEADKWIEKIKKR